MSVTFTLNSTYTLYIHGRRLYLYLFIILMNCFLFLIVPNCFLSFSWFHLFLSRFRLWFGSFLFNFNFVSAANERKKSSLRRKEFRKGSRKERRKERITSKNKRNNRTSISSAETTIWTPFSWSSLSLFPFSDLIWIDLCHFIRFPLLSKSHSPSLCSLYWTREEP